MGIIYVKNPLDGQQLRWEFPNLKILLRRKGPTLQLGVPWLIRTTGGRCGGSLDGKYKLRKEQPVSSIGYP